VNKQVVAVMAAAAWLACAGVAGAQAMDAQAPPPDGARRVISPQEIELLRKDIRSQKKQLIAQNLKLTDSDATKFWPIYDRYTAELVKINDKKYAAIQEYADHYGTLSDQQALSLMKQWEEVDVAAAQLRAKYLPNVTEAIGGKNAATFAQIDRRLTLMIELQLSSKIPLLQSQ
jgi:Spy/CpxP family protein refolding chaperone